MANIIGDRDPNALAGSPDDDVLVGFGGNDTLAGFGGFDLLLGGAGSDTADFSWSATDVSIDLAQGQEFNGNVALFSIESAIGSEIDDVILGNGRRNRLDGGGGDDSLAGRNDNDTLIGGGGADTLDGGDGIDQVRYDLAAGAVVVDLAAGFATGGAGSDSLVDIENAVGSAFADRLSGTAGANRLAGRQGDDTLAGFGGFDTLVGGSGTDTADFSWSATDISVDLAAGREFNENVTLIGIENVIGGSADDVLLGGTGANRLEGGAGGDVIEGGDGDDTLVGGSGTDTLDGGAGADLFLFGVGDGGAVVNDFEVGVDRIGILPGFTGLGIAASGDDVLVSYGGDSIRLVNVTVASLLPDFVLG